MKRVFALFLALLCFFLASCSAGLAPVEGETPAETKDALNEKKTEAKTETKTEEKVFEDPKEDGEMNILLIGNSYSYYWCDELYGMLAAAGYENAKIYNVYYSGCKFYQHWEWLVNHENHYQLFCNDKNGRKGTSDVDLPYCLSRENWDVISFDNNAATFGSGNAATAIDICEPYFGKLHAYMKKNFPDARLLWHEVWATEIGAKKSTFEVNDKEKRTQIYEAKHDVMHHMMKEYGVEGVPTGDAWEKIRDLPLFTTPISGTGRDRFTLCTRIMSGKIKDDFGHDGDIGGGQYLNACVWFEILTGKSCLGNSFRPKYELDGKNLSLTEEKIALLQKTAHETVAEFKGN